jgi:hypothetical protein
LVPPRWRLHGPLDSRRHPWLERVRACGEVAATPPTSDEQRLLDRIAVLRADLDANPEAALANVIASEIKRLRQALDDLRRGK